MLDTKGDATGITRQWSLPRRRRQKQSKFHFPPQERKVVRIKKEDLFPKTDVVKRETLKKHQFKYYDKENGSGHGSSLLTTL